MPRYVMTHSHFQPGKGMVKGAMTVTTADPAALYSRVQDQVANHIQSCTYFYLPELLGPQNPFLFVDEQQRFVSPTFELEEEWVQRLQREEAERASAVLPR